MSHPDDPLRAELDDRLRSETLIADASAPGGAAPSDEVSATDKQADQRTTLARLAAAVDVAGLGFYQMTDRGETVVLDDRARAFLGIPPDQEARTRAFWLEHVRPDDLDRVLEVSRDVLSGESERASVDYGYHHPTRGLVWYSHSVRAVDRNPDGTVTSVAGVLQDITARRRAEDALREHAEQFRVMTTTTADGFWVVDADGRVVDANEECRRIYGYSRDELLALSIKDVEATRDEAETQRHIGEILKAGYSRFETRHRRKDGRVIDVEVSTTFRPSAGTFLTFIRDITERKRAEDDLRQALAEVQRLRERLEHENVYLRQAVSGLKESGRIVGQSVAIRQALMQVEQVAITGSTVLLLGETGTGKELFASAIHDMSPRRDRAMVRVNCAAIPATLIESELFGRERGAYTGALSKQVGRFEMANGSTIFLDEIGDLPMDTQVKLLRVLQERQIERLGSPRPIAVDVRIVAASNRDLAQAMREGRFREDLFYRLDVFPIRVPPLRERLEDVPLLVEALVDELAGVMGKRFESISRASIDALKGYSWPGNVRELRNVIERAMIVATGPVLRMEPPGLSQSSLSSQPQPKAGGLDRAQLLDLLEKTGWRIRGENGAATVLGVKPTTLEARLAKLGIERPGKNSTCL